MIGAMSFAANLTEFLLTKLIGKKVEIALDEKKKAARAFLNLFDSISCLERSLTCLERQFENVVSGAQERLFAVEAGVAIEQLQAGTNSFMKSINQLESIIEIFDPDLAITLFGVRSVKEKKLGIVNPPHNIKMNLLWGNSEYVFAIEIFEPAETDILLYNRIYNEVSYGAERAISKFIPWHKKRSEKSLQGAYGDLAHPKQINRYEIASNDTQKLQSVLLGLRKHISSLSSSRNELAKFMKSLFSLEDLLR